MFNFKNTKKLSFTNKLIIFFVMIITLFYIIHITNQKSIYSSGNISSDVAKDKTFDYDGDGSPDDITLISTNSTYSIRIKNSFGESLLNSSTNDFSLLDITTNCFPTIHFVDLSRNKIPELIISGIKNHKPVFYVFQWQDVGFKEIFFSTDNILGIINYNNSRTPQLLSSNSNKNDGSATGLIINNSSTKDISFSNPIIPGFNSIQQLIDVIELDYELEETPDIFNPYIDTDQLGLLWTLDKSKYRYSFQKVYFYDTSWDDSRNTTSIYWCLSFKRTNILNTNEPNKELLFYVTTDLNNSGEYKIASMLKN